MQSQAIVNPERRTVVSPGVLPALQMTEILGYRPMMPVEVALEQNDSGLTATVCGASEQWAIKSAISRWLHTSPELCAEIHAAPTKARLTARGLGRFLHGCN